MDSIGRALFEAREESGVSLAEASNDLELKEAVLENVEAGKIGAFKNIFELKKIISTYAKYLGLDDVKLIDEFNEFMFEYTSKIPIKELEKTVEIQVKEEEKDKIISPYTKKPKKYDDKVYILIYLILIILIVLAVFWSLKQVTMDLNEIIVISYRR